MKCVRRIFRGLLESLLGYVSTANSPTQQIIITSKRVEINVVRSDCDIGCRRGRGGSV